MATEQRTNKDHHVCDVHRSLAAAGPQDRANHAWQELAAELGFVWDTARPVAGEGMDVFTAEVSDGA